jgi:hypothetical protein
VRTGKLPYAVLLLHRVVVAESWWLEQWFRSIHAACSEEAVIPQMMVVIASPSLTLFCAQALYPRVELS